ncbi:MAG: hypothetical protein ACYDAD_15010, partial [Acidimicrobiales bacterium]
MVPTFRRPAALARVLAGLAVQEDPGLDWEVVVVDNDGSAGGPGWGPGGGPGWGPGGGPGWGPGGGPGWGPGGGPGGPGGSGGPGGQGAAGVVAGARLPVPVRLVVEPAPGAVAARWRGATEATGELVVFLD